MKEPIDHKTRFLAKLHGNTLFWYSECKLQTNLKAVLEFNVAEIKYIFKQTIVEFLIFLHAGF